MSMKENSKQKILLYGISVGITQLSLNLCPIHSIYAQDKDTESMPVRVVEGIKEGVNAGLKRMQTKGFAGLTTRSDFENALGSAARKILHEEAFSSWASMDADTLDRRITLIKSNLQLLYTKMINGKPIAGAQSTVKDEIFHMAWINSLNSAYEIYVDAPEQKDESEYDLKLKEQLGIDDNNATQDQDANKSKDGKIKIKTTILNYLLRNKQTVDLKRKVETLITYGASKNLVSAFSENPIYDNQPNYPIKALAEGVEDSETKSEILSIFFNDKIGFSGNDNLSEENKLASFDVTLKSHAIEIAQHLIKQKDEKIFQAFLESIEKKGIFLIEDYEDLAGQIEDQLECPPMVAILKEMERIKNLTKLTMNDDMGVSNQGRVVYAIDFFLNQDLPKKHMEVFNIPQKVSEIEYEEDDLGRLKMKIDRRNYREQFSEEFRRKINDDSNYTGTYGKDLLTTLAFIEKHRTVSELQSKHFRDLLVKYLELGYYRNLLCHHLNKFGLFAANKGGNFTNVTRLIRYVQIRPAAESYMRELEDYQGKQIILLQTNRYGWTPLHYASIQRKNDAIKLLLSLYPYLINVQDALGMNIMHLAFPMSEDAYQHDGAIDTTNVLNIAGGLTKSNVTAKDESMSVVKSLLEFEAIDKSFKVAALKQRNAMGYTVLAYAGALGYVEVYDYIIRWLKTEGATVSTGWDPSEHSYEGDDIDRVLLDGINRAKNLQYEGKDIRNTQEKELLQKIYIEREKQYKKKNHKALTNAFDRKYNSVEYQWLCKDIFESISNIQYVAAGKLRDPFVKATETLVSRFKMFIPGAIMAKSKFFNSLARSNSQIKFSYLSPIMKELVNRYYHEKKGKTKAPMKSLYKALTGDDTLTYFSTHLDSEIEGKVQELLTNTMKELDKLDESNKTKSKSFYQKAGQEYEVTTNPYAKKDQQEENENDPLEDSQGEIDVNDFKIQDNE